MEKIIVCVKPIPDPRDWDRISLDPDTGIMHREGIPSVINPLDRNAVEAALQLKEGPCPGAEIVLLSMAPPFTSPALKEMLAMGADRAVLLSDRLFAGSDTLATSAIMAAAIKRLGAFDLVLCGDMTLDGSTAQVPSQLAEFLGVPNVMHVTGINPAAPGRLHLTRKIEKGSARLEANPPLLISVVKGVNKPRYIPFTGILEADRKEIVQWSNKDLDLDLSQIGPAGSPTRMAGISLRAGTRAREILSGHSPEELARK
ncbi:MAG: electron transfer flavoprotein subunit beta/FixA family protein, partial [Deltaproteobacteria bacterium]|nr:electron transfer flavoprotein subunit beta/FixA family protein [Deltaproteobacteria bacterium]